MRGCDDRITKRRQSEHHLPCQDLHRIAPQDWDEALSDFQRRSGVLKMTWKKAFVFRTSVAPFDAGKEPLMRQVRQHYIVAKFERKDHDRLKTNSKASAERAYRGFPRC